MPLEACITDVVPQAAAYKVGIRKGDVITKVDGRRVKERDQVVKFVGSNDPGDAVRIEVKRIDLETYNVPWVTGRLPLICSTGISK